MTEKKIEANGVIPLPEPPFSENAIQAEIPKKRQVAQAILTLQAAPILSPPPLERKVSPPLEQKKGIHFCRLNVNSEVDRTHLVPLIDAYYTQREGRESRGRNGMAMPKAELWRSLENNQCHAIGVMQDGFVLGAAFICPYPPDRLEYAAVVKCPHVGKNLAMEYGKALDDWLHETYKARMHLHLMDRAVARLAVQAGMGKIEEDTVLVIREFGNA